MQLLGTILSEGQYTHAVTKKNCQIWHSSLTEENTSDVERVQKTALKIILGDKYQNYEKWAQGLGRQSWVLFTDTVSVNNLFLSGM